MLMMMLMLTLLEYEVCRSTEGDLLSGIPQLGLDIYTEKLATSEILPLNLQSHRA
jgi:hypothetical protein